MPIIEDVELRNLFRIESAEHLQKLDAGLLSLEKKPDDPLMIQEVFREAHSLKGAARMLGLIDIQGLANGVEDMLGAARSGQLLITAEVIKPQLAILDLIRQRVAEVVGVPCEVSVPTPAPIVPSTVSAEVAIHVEPYSSQEFHIDTLRVDAKKLDFLLSQAGELVVSRSRLLKWHRDFEVSIQRFSGGDISKDQLIFEAQQLRVKLLEDASRLSVITEEIEGGIRGLRLLPISTLLEQFPRMVHDLAAAQGKQVELLFEGETTVADKRIIEEMKSPLMHMLRNAIDHGIEDPEIRLRAGKSSVGKILIKISQDVSHVRIELSDDGRGLDMEAIRQQSVKRHLFSDAQASALDEAQLKNVLMTPGFSTSQRITEISGRGVGLDVVRASVEQMRGSLDMDSHAGRGMVFTLTLPVSLTSTRVMIFKEWGEIYAFPCEAIYFSKIVKSRDLLVREDRHYFYHGDEVITVCRLGVVLGKRPRTYESDTSMICVMIKFGDWKVGLLVDEIHREEDIVIKVLPLPMKRLRYVSGVTILDSGLVCAVLNATDLAKSIHQGHVVSVDTLKSDLARLSD